MPISLVGHSVLLYFPEVHPDAVLSVDFQSTLRVPDDGTTYGLPPGLGRLPVRRVADLPDRRLSQRWMASGGVVMPMWQSQACWLNFSGLSVSGQGRRRLDQCDHRQVLVGGTGF